ncbi:hypothetical protein GCM10007063_16430 [Lentibacillus kapialis]|uniref:DUF2627 domain-containing protein n=1 Tax=Lentibacillus kapialis TaxID=340214 RepID=A0A917PWA6_9BACI|nr:DUF2627 domain-containing protein [Lentibacillus kapialis]GGJ94618.1 hypothetical protein GCM10007063_16430 [Lentibacillus kapialis]
MIRFVAVLMLLIPGIISAVGIKLMRDSLFNDFYPVFFHISIQFIAGFLLFLGGLAFIAGFIVYRDRKNQKNKRQSK